MMEPAYPQIGIRPELEGIEKIDGRYAYKIKAVLVKIPIYSFYDSPSGSKVRTAIPEPNGGQVPRGEEYKKIGKEVLYAYGLRREKM